MSSGIAVPNGKALGKASSQWEREAQFYDTLLRLQDDIFAGRHSRFKLPAYLAPVTKPTPPADSASVPKQITNTQYLINDGPPQDRNDAQDGSAVAITYEGTAKQAPATEKTAKRASGAQGPSSSGIDPVLLSKSDQLIEAEMRLKRQRLERALHDQMEQMKTRYRDKDLGLEAPVTLDLTRLLANALKIVKPVSGLRPVDDNDNRASSDSFDEHDYYSSQVNETSEEEERGSAQGGANAVQKKVAKQERPTIEGTGKVKKTAAVPENLSEPVGLPSSERQARALKASDYWAHKEHGTRQLYRAIPRVDVEQEGGKVTSDAPNSAQAARGKLDLVMSDDGTPHVAAQESGSRVQPKQNPHRVTQKRIATASPLSSTRLQVIRNQITFPLAPQPTRISPIAATRRDGRNADYTDSESRRPSEYGRRPRRGSPVYDLSGSGNEAGLQGNPQAQPAPKHAPSPRHNAGEAVNETAGTKRKRPRGPEARQANKRHAPLRTTSPARATSVQIFDHELSPEPYVKPEPISPLPLSAVIQAPRRYSKATESRTQYGPEEFSRHYGEAPFYVDHEQQIGGTYDTQRLMPSQFPGRAPSQVAVRPQGSIPRQGHDLRRLASLQYARKGYGQEPPSLSYVPGRTEVTQATSPLYAETSPRYYQEPPTASHAQYINPDGSLSLSGQYNARPQRLGSQSILARPSPVAYVVDQYGRKYYLAPPSPEIQLIDAPPTRRTEHPPYQEPIGYSDAWLYASNEAPLQRGTSRPPLRAIEIPDDDPVVGSMLPPPRPPPGRRALREPEPEPEYEPGAEHMDRPGYYGRQYSQRPAIYNEVASQAPRRPQMSRVDDPYAQHQSQHKALTPIQYVRPLSSARAEPLVLAGQRYGSVPVEPQHYVRRVSAAPSRLGASSAISRASEYGVGPRSNGDRYLQPEAQRHLQPHPLPPPSTRYINEIEEEQPPEYVHEGEAYGREGRRPPNYRY